MSGPEKSHQKSPGLLGAVPHFDIRKFMRHSARLFKQSAEDGGAAPMCWKTGLGVLWREPRVETPNPISIWEVQKRAGCNVDPLVSIIRIIVIAIAVVIAIVNPYWVPKEGP